MSSHTRLPQMTSEQLSTTLDRIEQDELEMKSSAPQYVGGASVANFISSTGTTHDWSGTLTARPSVTTHFGSNNWAITATAATAPILYAQIIVYLYVNGSASRYVPSNYLTDLVAGGSVRGFQSYVTDVSNDDITQTNVRTWALKITGDEVRTVAWKVYVIGLDEVTIGITQLN